MGSEENMIWSMPISQRDQLSVFFKIVTTFMYCSPLFPTVPRPIH